MSTNAQSAAHQLDDQDALDDAAPLEHAASERARPIPRISIQAFCEGQRLADVLQHAAEDRRLSKAHVSVHMGGAKAAVVHYQENPTPNLIVIESVLPRLEMLHELDQLAES